jgi:hypothetical protein
MCVIFPPYSSTRKLPAEELKTTRFYAKNWLSRQKLIRLDVAFLYSADGPILHFWFGDFSGAVRSFGDFHSILSHVGITIPKGKLQMSGVKDKDLNTSLASIVATVVAFTSTRCGGFWLARWLRARGIEHTSLVTRGMSIECGVASVRSCVHCPILRSTVRLPAYPVISE